MSKNNRSRLLFLVKLTSVNKNYCMAEGGVFIGRVLKFSSEETDLFPHYRKSFCMAASGVNDCSLNYWLRLPI